MTKKVPAFEKAGRCELSGQPALVQAPFGSYRCPACNKLLTHKGARRAPDGYHVTVPAHADAARTQPPTRRAQQPAPCATCGAPSPSHAAGCPEAALVASQAAARVLGAMTASAGDAALRELVGLCWAALDPVGRARVLRAWRDCADVDLGDLADPEAIL